MYEENGKEHLSDSLAVRFRGLSSNNGESKERKMESKTETRGSFEGAQRDM